MWGVNMFGKLIKFIMIGFIVWLLLPFILGPYLREEYRAMMNRSSAFLINDRSGEWMGVLPGVIDPHGDFDSIGWISEDHKTVVPKVTDSYAIYGVLIRTLEDRNFARLGVRSIHGTDVPRTLKAILTLGRSGGGSGLTQQLWRNLYHLSPYGETTGEKIRRKGFELIMGPALFRVLGPDGVVHAYASHIPLVSSCSSVPLGGDVYGVELCSNVLFGHSFEECTLAEVGLLAAASWRPAIMTRAADGCGWELNADRFERLRDRAKSGFRSAPGFFADDISTEMADSAIAELERMAPPRMRIFEEELWGSSTSQRLANATNPSRRALLHKSAMIEGLSELSAMTDGSWRTIVREVDLSIDSRMNLLVAKAAQRGMHKLEDGKAFSIPIVEGHPDERAQVLIAVADQDGDLLALYSNQDLPIYSSHSGRFIGSTGKIMAAIAMGASGYRPETMLLNKTVDGVQNPGGDLGCKSARQSGSMYPADIVFGRSLNLPLIDALNGSYRRGLDLEDLVSDCGFRIAPTVPAVTAITLGEMYGSPRDLHSLVSELLGILDAGYMPTYPIRLVREMECFIEDDPRATGRDSAPVGFRPHILPYLDSAQSRHFVSSVLSAPLKPGGTFARLGRFTPERSELIELSIAKGGTVVSKRGGPATDLLACGGMVLRNTEYRRISWIVVMRSPSPSRPLGNVASSHMQPLIYEILSLFVSG